MSPFSKTLNKGFTRGMSQSLIIYRYYNKVSVFHVILLRLFLIVQYNSNVRKFPHYSTRLKAF